MRRSDFFAQPAHLEMRRYEALRAYLHEGCSAEEAARRGRYTIGSFRNLLTRFNKQPTADFFWPAKKKKAPQSKPTNPRHERIVTLRTEENLTITQIQKALKQEGLPASVGYIYKVFAQEKFKRMPRRSPAQRAAVAPVADRRQLDLSPRTIETDFAGLFLFAFDLARTGLEAMLKEVGMPGTRMIPAGCAVRALLALKLWGIGRPYHVSSEALDEGLALFAGLNAIPKRTTLTDYAVQVDPAFAAPLMHRWYHAAVGLDQALAGGQSMDLDFHTIPYHGDQALLEKHFVSKRSRRQRGVLAVLARDANAQVFLYAETNLRKDTQMDAVFRFVDYWREMTGQPPGELVFDSRFTTYANLAKLNEAGIHFITLRRRHPSLITHIHTLDQATWKRIQLKNIGRKYRTPRIVDETTHLRNYSQRIRQILIQDLGHDKPTILLTNQMTRPASQLVDRYARRMVIENVISDAIDFFHMDALSSAVPMRINVDVQLTVIASVLYRLLGLRIRHGYERAESRTIFRDLVRHTGKITITENDLIVTLRPRAKSPFLKAANYHTNRVQIPWLDHKWLQIKFAR